MEIILLLLCAFSIGVLLWNLVKYIYNLIKKTTTYIVSKLKNKEEITPKHNFTLNANNNPIERKEYNGITESVYVNSPFEFNTVLVYRWFVENFEMVEKDRDILEITNYVTYPYTEEPKFKYRVKSPVSGVLVKGEKFAGWSLYKTSPKIGDNLFSIYSDDSKLKDFFPNKIIVKTDEFTKSSIVEGEICAGNPQGFRLGRINLNFENNGGCGYALLTYNRKDIKLNKKCSLCMLLEDDSTIILNAVSNPIKLMNSDTSTLRFKLYYSDFKKFEVKNFLKWRIIGDDGHPLISGEVSFCGKTNFARNLSYEIFKNYMKEFNSLVAKYIPNEYLEKADEECTENTKSQDSCYVYLMVDTTNNFHKIGISNQPKYREHTLQSDKPTIELICAKKYPSRNIAVSIEAALHNTYSSKRIRGEWFNLDETDISDIKKTLM